MKFCLSSQQSEKVLAQADEIKTKHFEEVMRLLRKFPKANVIFEVPHDFDITQLDELQELNNKYDNRLIICANKFELINILSSPKYTMRYYFGFYVSTFLEARALLDAGVSCLKLAAPLTHQINKVIELGCDIRLIPNIATTDEFYSKYGFEGSWIRPEDGKLYEPYGDQIVFEFEDCDEKKEATLFDIYKNKKEWPGPMNLIFSNLNTNAVNRLIPPDLGEKRMNCGQGCLIDGRCHLCKTSIVLADKELLEKIIGPDTRNF